MPHVPDSVAVMPYTHHLNLVMQWIATIALWAGTAATLIWAAVLGKKRQTILPVALVLAVAVGSILEPIYDILYHLLWYTSSTATQLAHGDITGKQWTFFTAFGIPQPVWVMPAYVIVFALPALIMYDRIAKGASPALIIKMAIILVLTTALFETTANNLNLYGYYASAPMRLLKYPDWIAFMESAQITGYAILCAVLAQRKTREVQCLALFALFPANFGFDVLGAGFPTLIAMNQHHPSTAVMWITSFISIGLAAVSLYWTAQLVLPRKEGAGQGVWSAALARTPVEATPAPAPTGAPAPSGTGAPAPSHA